MADSTFPVKGQFWAMTRGKTWLRIVNVFPPSAWSDGAVTVRNLEGGNERGLGIKDLQHRYTYQPEKRCQWFAYCIREAHGVVSHPTLGDVPTCKECADALGLTLKEIS